MKIHLSGPKFPAFYITLFALCTFSLGADYTDVGSGEFGGSLAYSFFTPNTGNSLTIVEVAPSMNLFFMKYFMAGPAISYTATWADTVTIWDIGLGVSVGSAYPISYDKTLFAYWASGFQWHRTGVSYSGIGVKDYYYSIPFSIGLKWQIQKHIALNIAPLINFEPRSGIQIAMSLGISWLYF